MTTWRALTTDDVTALTALANAVTAADGTGGPVAEATVAQMFDAPGYDAALDSFGGWIDGELVAFGSVWAVPEPVDGRALVRVDGGVDPEHRRRGIGGDLLTRMEARAGELGDARHAGLPIRVRTDGGLPDSATQRHLEAAGYEPDNYFVTMEAALPDWQDPGSAPAAEQPDEDALAATRDAHNDAFRDHRNSSAIPPEQWQHWMAAPAGRHDLSRVVRDGDRVLAYALVSEYQPGVAHVELVGTRREARGRGLARAVLLGMLRAAHEAGFAVAELEVDSTSPTGANRLYTSVGFVPVRTISRYQRDLSPTSPA